MRVSIQADIEIMFKIPSLRKAEAFNPKWVNPEDVCAQKGTIVRGGVGPFGILALTSQNFEEYTPVFFSIFKSHNNNHTVLMCSGGASRYFSFFSLFFTFYFRVDASIYEFKTNQFN